MSLTVENTPNVGMPLHVVEILETEIVARTVSTLLNKLLAESEEVAAVPAPAVALFLNLLLGKVKVDNSFTVLPMLKLTVSFVLSRK
jgi:hypothetical protein